MQKIAMLGSGFSFLTEYDNDHYLVKEELTHYGEKKVILKEKKSGKIIEKII